jgi:hypothetical protein
MRRILDEVYAAIDRLPADHQEKLRVRDTARRYHRACGCVLSGVFLIFAIAASVAWLIVADPFRWSLAAACLVGVFCAGLLGKAIGIGWAKARLRLLHHSLVRRIEAERDCHVDLHELGDQGRQHLQELDVGARR